MSNRIASRSACHARLVRFSTLLNILLVLLLLGVGVSSAAGVQPISPTPGSTLSGSTVTFSWPGGSSQYELLLGTTLNGSDILNTGHTTATSVTPTNLPVNALPVYARLYRLDNGVWTAANYVYTAFGTPAASTLFSPSPGTALPCGIATFSWTSGTGVSQYQFQLGTTLNGSNLATTGHTTATSLQVSDLPANGLPVYARLYSLINGVWSATNYTYTACGTPTPSVLLTPAPGSTVTTPGTTFTWSQGVAVSQYDLRVGTTLNGGDIYESGHTTATSSPLVALPGGNKTIFVRLYSLIGSTWTATNYTFTGPAAAISVNITPSGSQSYVQGSPNATFSATTSNDPLNQGVSWSLNPSGCGFLSNATTTTVTFVVPTTVSQSCTTQLIAMSVADPSKSNFDTITVYQPAPALTIDPTQNGSVPYGLVGQTYQLYLNAQGGVAPYQSFSTASGSIPPGLSYSVAANSLVGTLTADSVTYPHTYTFTVSVKDSVGTIATSPSISVVVNAAPNHEHDSWLNGRYVCLTKGFIDNSGSPFPWASLVSFPFTGTSTYSGGTFDMAYGGTVTGAGVLNSGTVTGTVNIGADNHGIVTFTSTPAGGTAGKPTTWAVEANNIAGPTATEIHAIEIDDLGATPSGEHANASCYLADTSAFKASNVDGQSFAFAVSGNNAGGLAKDSIGAISLSGGLVSGGTIDNAKGDGTFGSSNFTTGTAYTEPDSTTGRFVVTTTAGPNTNKMIFYMIDANRAVVLVVGSSAPNGMQSGNVRRQLNSPYSNASLNGPFVVYYHSKGFSTTLPVTVLGYGSTLIQGQGDGVTGFTMNLFYQDQAPACTNNSNCSGTLSTNPPGTYTLAIAGNGRGTFNPNPTGTGLIYFYMYDNNAALFMDATGSSQGNGLGIGWVDSQTATTSTDVTGTYVMSNMPPSDPSADDNTGMLTLAGGNITGTSDSAGQGWFSWDEALSDSGGSITYSGPTTYNLITITQTGSTKGLDCIGITSKKIACISEDDKPNIIILKQ